MSEPHTRLDEAMKARSIEIGKRWVRIAREAKITTSALGGIRRGEYKPSAHTARALEDALEWAHGSIERILAGGEPTVVVQKSDTDSAKAVDDVVSVAKDPLAGLPEDPDERLTAILQRQEDLAEQQRALATELRELLGDERSGRETG
jgi:hypothetical protein